MTARGGIPIGDPDSSNLNTTSIYTIPSALDLEHAVAQIGE
jgi:hypothetical protein